MCQAVQAEKMQPICAVHLWAEPLWIKHSTLKCLERGFLVRQPENDCHPYNPMAHQNSSVPADLEEDTSSPPQQAPALSRSKKKQRKKAKQWAKFAVPSGNREPSDSEPSTVSNDIGERSTADGKAVEADSSSKETAGEELSEEALLQRMMAASSLNTWADVQELVVNSHSAEAEAVPVAGVPQSAGQQQTTDSDFGDAPNQTRAQKRPGRGKIKKKAAAKGLEGTPKASLSATACMVCGAECSTRNRLFKHIKDTGHAALK